MCEFGGVDNLLDGSDKKGNTPLFVAVKHNSVECLKVLITYNCNLFHRNGRGDSCLHYAALHDAEESIIILGDYVGEHLFKARNRQGMTPFDIA